MEYYKNIIKQQLKLKGKLCFKVKGVSMLPTIQDGERVEVFVSNNYYEGEIILFIYNKRFLLHRIIKIHNGFYFCKGDNTVSLERIRIEDIIGKVQGHGG